MAINYSISMLRNPRKPQDPKKAYAKAQVSEQVTLEKLSDQIASQTTVSRADVSASLIAAVDNMYTNLCEGRQVDFGDLGKFRMQLRSKGAANAKEFTAANITKATIQFVPGKKLKDIFTQLQFNPVASRAAAKAVLKAQKAGEKVVDISVVPKANKPEEKPADKPADKPTENPTTGGGTSGKGEGF